MNIRTITVESLTSEEIAAWSAIQRSVPMLSSPYFRPEFTQAVAAVRDDVEVAVLENSGRPVGFFPFQRTPWNAGRPIAGRLSDYHALIAPAEVECDPVTLIRACGLSSWHFGHLVEVHKSFEPFAWSRAESPYIDLSDGFDAYLKQRGGTRKAATLAVAGLLSLVIGLAIAPWYPPIKAAWTTTFNLQAGGISLMLLAGFYLVIDVWQINRWTFFFRVIGLNAITIYMAPRIIDFPHASEFLFTGVALLVGVYGPLVLITGSIGLKWLFLWFLYHKKLFLRV